MQYTSNQAYSLKKEAEVSSFVVLRVLLAMGWIDEPHEVHLENREKNGAFTDVLLTPIQSNYKVLVEVKAPKVKLDWTYLKKRAINAEIQFAVLTNGLEWVFLRIKNDSEHQFVNKLQLTKDSREEFSRLLGREHFVSGSVDKYWINDISKIDGVVANILSEFIRSDDFCNCFLKYSKNTLETLDQSLVKKILEQQISTLPRPRPKNQTANPAKRKTDIRDRIVSIIRNCSDKDLNGSHLRSGSEIRYYCGNQNVQLLIRVAVKNRPQITFQIAISSKCQDLISAIEVNLPFIQDEAQVPISKRLQTRERSRHTFFEWSTEACEEELRIIDQARRYIRVVGLLKKIISIY